MDKVKEYFHRYIEIENSVKSKRKDLEARLKEIEKESRVLAIETSASKRVALTKVLEAIGETAVNEQVRKFALRSMNFASIDGTENEILRLIECDLDKLTVGDKVPPQLRCIPRFSIGVLDGYDNILDISYDPSLSGTITEIELSIRGKYDR